MGSKAELEFASHGSTGWTVQQVDSDAAGVALALDAKGRQRIAYRSAATGQVRHAFWGPDP